MAFVVLHLWTFKYGAYYSTVVDGVEMRDLYRLVVEKFQEPLYVAWYVFALLLLGGHLTHGSKVNFSGKIFRADMTQNLPAVAGFDMSRSVSGGADRNSVSKIIAIGGSDAGISAALRARELDPTSEVTVVVADDDRGIREALADEDVTVAASTAGATNPPARPRNAVLERYLPGDAMSERARLVVCNGGSLSVQQALMAGTPVLALATNMDQFLNMAPVAACGAGIVLRTDRLSPETVRRAAQALLASVPAQKEAARLGALLRRQPRPEIAFAAALASLLPRR